MQLKNVKIINYDKTISNANVSFENGKITKIEQVDGKATHILIPGFIDEHIHGFRDRECMESVEAVEFISSELQTVGVTAFMPVVMTENREVMLQSLANVAEAKFCGARNIGTHLEGPFISKAKKGAHIEAFLMEPSIELLKTFVDASKNTIRKMTIAPELFSDDEMAFLNKQNIIISVGHSNGTSKDLNRAIQHGASSVTHLWNAMTGVANREPGIVTGALNSDAIYAEVIADFIHIDQETIRLTIRAKGVGRVIVVTDANKLAGCPDGESNFWGQTIVKKGLLATLKGTNTIAGSVTTIYDEFKNLINMGFSINDAVCMTSFNQAQHLNLDGMGYISEGNHADFVLLSNELEIIDAFVAGKGFKK